MNKIIQGDCIEVLKTLDSESVDCCITSPPYYGLRVYLPDGVVLKSNAPAWVLGELIKLGIFPRENK